VDERHLVRPADINGVHKAAGEYYHLLYHQVFGIRASSLRLTNVYGPRQLIKHNRQGFIGWFIRLAIEGEEIQVFGDGAQTRDFVYVDDVARANLLALESRQTGALNVGTGRETSVNELAAILAREAGFARPIAHGPPAAGEQRRSSVDPAAARTQLGWSPRTALQDGLRRTAEWFAERSRPNSP
jgi:UDP-glucose 4-epimerase